MNAGNPPVPLRRAFSLVELIAVVIILALLAGMALPRFMNHADRAKEAACRSNLANVRAAIASYYTNGAIAGSPVYPTYLELTAIGTVIQQQLPENPYNEETGVADFDGLWNALDPPVNNTTGWAYDEAAGKFWANSDVIGENEL